MGAHFNIDNFRGLSREGDWQDIAPLTEHNKDVAKIAVVNRKERKDNKEIRIGISRAKARRTKIRSTKSEARNNIK